MSKRLDLVGQKFGRLTVQEFSGMNKRSDSIWNCICDCGGYKKVLGSDLKRRHTKSCGCLQKERITTHGQTIGGLKSLIYCIWGGIMSRCYNSKHRRYKDYGGRGIKVYLPWHKFENFYGDVGDVPEGMTLDRVNNDGNYEPGNWRFATPREQANNKRNNVWYEYGGERKTISQWARSKGMSPALLRHRLNRDGWSIEKALTTLVKHVLYK